MNTKIRSQLKGLDFRIVRYFTFNVQSLTTKSSK